MGESRFALGAITSDVLTLKAVVGAIQALVLSVVVKTITTVDQIDT